LAFGLCYKHTMLKVRNKRLRIGLRLLLGFFILIVVVFAGVSVYVESNKTQLLEKLRKGINENLRGDLQYRKADITIWRNFPFIGVRLYDVNLEDSVYHMPFIKMKEVQVQVSLLQLLRKNTELRNLKLSDGVLHFFTDSSGYTNKYLTQLKKKKDSSIKHDIMLNHAALRNVRVILENRQRNKLFDFVFRKLDAGIASSGNLINIDLKNDVVVNTLAFSMKKGSYLKSQPIKMNIDLTYDKAAATLSFKEETFKVNGHNYLMKGKFMVRGQGYFELDARTKDAPYNKLLAVFPENIASKLRLINLEKSIDAQAHLNGGLGFRSVPKVFATWVVKKNTLTTEVAKFTDCSFTGSFSNEKVKGLGFTDPNSEIVLNNFSGNWDGIALSGKNISVTNLVEP